MNVLQVPVFRPTMAEFLDFDNYINSIEINDAHKVGLAKIIPPKEWIPRKAGYENINLEIKSPIKQMISGNDGVYVQTVKVHRKSMKFNDFREESFSQQCRTPPYTDFADLE
jgi:[histone H3]-trimethyl-L-lysine9/36 demethylase